MRAERPRSGGYRAKAEKAARKAGGHGDHLFELVCVVASMEGKARTAFERGFFFENKTYGQKQVLNG
jgi:hypothetical protein